MAKAKRILAADLFCGAGGTSTGLLRAAELLGRPVELTAVNHWDRAIETHAKNHPAANHFCQSLADLDPKKAVPGGKLDLLVASPECTHHSVARGGKPVNDQSRASAYCVHRWCAALEIKRVLIENVPEFQGWGPLGTNNKPLASKKGHLFTAFVNTFKAMGYRVEWRVLNAADYGGATTRRRLFIQAVKGKLPIHWPERTHEPEPKAGLFGTLTKWRAAREIIDWSLPGESIFGRKRPLSENTLKRIEAGLRKFGGANAEPFLVLLRGTSADQVRGSARSADSPLPPVTCSGGHFGLVEPFLTSFNGKPEEDRRRHDLNNPLPTQHCSNRFGIVQPFIIPTNYGEREGQSPRCHNIDRPCPTVVAGGVTHGLVEPFIMHTTHHGEGRVYDPNEPLPCVTGANRGEQALVQPFILPHRQFDGMQVDDVDNPLRTVTAQNGACNALVQPFIVPQNSSNGPRSVDEPAPTLTTTSRGVGVCEPFITPFYANGEADSVAGPLRTVTTKDRFGLCEPQIDGPARLDIRFRMLQPHELAAAMGFPRDYKIAGNRSEQVRQVGNAVEVNQAAALCGAILQEAA